MGAPTAQVQPSQTSQPQGKGAPIQPPIQQPIQAQNTDNNQPMGKGGRITYPGQGGQPQIGQPNRYSNTVGQWDNASIGTRPSGKGKGA